MSLVDISGRIAHCFPLGESPISLELVDGESETDPESPPRAVATVRLIVWDIDDETGARSIRDIKEQQILMGYLSLFDDVARIEAFFAALDGIVRELTIDVVETLMPDDLVRCDALELKRARTREDFDAALRARSRLGTVLSAPKS